MNNHSGKGRHLWPINFNKEIYLEFNLGPTYLTEKLVRSLYELRKKEYLYKETAAGGVAYWTSQRGDYCGSAAHTHVTNTHAHYSLQGFMFKMYVIN